MPEWVQSAMINTGFAVSELRTAMEKAERSTDEIDQKSFKTWESGTARAIPEAEKEQL